MPLVIERQGDVVAVMHYFIQQGDLMRDPEVELSFRRAAVPCVFAR